MTHGTGRGRLERYRRWSGGAHHPDVRSDGPASDRSDDRDPGHPNSSATGTR